VERCPRVGTRVERAEEGRCEGEEILRDLTGLIIAIIDLNGCVDAGHGGIGPRGDLSGLMFGIAETGVESLC
jgi:hypothetical protein